MNEEILYKKVYTDKNKTGFYYFIALDKGGIQKVDNRTAIQENQNLKELIHDLAQANKKIEEELKEVKYQLHLAIDSHGYKLEKEVKKAIRINEKVMIAIFQKEKKDIDNVAKIITDSKIADISKLNEHLRKQSMKNKQQFHMSGFILEIIDSEYVKITWSYLNQSIIICGGDFETLLQTAFIKDVTKYLGGLKN